jgi:predicted acetyltransferase
MAVLECYKQGYPISMLFPFSHQFYKKVGYGLVGEKYVYSFSPLSLTQYDELLNVRLFDKKDLGAVKRVYIESSKRTSFRICRNDKHWKSLTESKDKNVVVYDNKCRRGHVTSPLIEGIKGYLIYKYEYSDNRIEQYLRVYEMIYLNDEAYRGLLGFLAAQREQVDSIIYHTTKDDPLHFALSNPRKTRSNARIVGSNAVLEVNADYMLRIVDLTKALLARKDYNNMNLCFSIKVADDIVKENNKPITMIVKNGKLIIKSGIKSDVVLESDISVFSQIYAGINSEYLHKIQFIKCNKPEVLKEIDEVFKLPAPDLLSLDGF